MRILVVSDIHANWPALAAIDEPHDLCLCLGDLVDYDLSTVLERTNQPTSGVRERSGT